MKFRKHNSFSRGIAVLVCYVLSGPGIWMNLMVSGAFGWFSLIFAYAWIAHLVMSIAWVRKAPLKWFWPISGSIAGACSLIMMPLGFLFVFPCILLAVHIIRSYWLSGLPAIASTPDY